ncbi:MAG: NAD(P)-dependent oxidoreductase [Betaproteobacteria bacterium]|nr:NAD(P)-dependent oxidoreductase [Betaproteobacteria bacterium]
MERLGFVGLGVMGEPMCRNLARKGGTPVIGYDVAPEPLERLAIDGVHAARSPAEALEQASVLFLSLPSGAQVQAVCEGQGGLLAQAKPGQTIVDLGTSPVALARSLAERFSERGAAFADAPVARTREAAIAGTLSIMVGANDATFQRIAPLLATMATEVTHCGGVGAGQLVKIMNNMVLAQTVIALAEALSAARRSGVDGKVLFETLAKGSADSFALRNHGMKAMLPGAFPERAFSTEYMLKDLQYALDLASDAGVAMRGARNARSMLEETIAAGHGKAYWPVVCKIVDRD